MDDPVTYRVFVGLLLVALIVGWVLGYVMGSAS